MRFQKSVFLLRWALNLAFALVAFGGKTCDGLDVLGLLGVCGGGGRVCQLGNRNEYDFCKKKKKFNGEAESEG